MSSVKENITKIREISSIDKNTHFEPQLEVNDRLLSVTVEDPRRNTIYQAVLLQS